MNQCRGVLHTPEVIKASSNAVIAREVAAMAESHKSLTQWQLPVKGIHPTLSQALKGRDTYPRNNGVMVRNLISNLILLTEQPQ
jgi:hypothetical protein